MSEDANKKPQIIMGGVSGNKEFVVRRVHKKSADASQAKDTAANAAPVAKSPESNETPAKAQPNTETVKTSVKAEAKEAPKAKSTAKNETVKTDASVDKAIKKTEESSASVKKAKEEKTVSKTEKKETSKAEPKEVAAPKVNEEAKISDEAKVAPKEDKKESASDSAKTTEVKKPEPQKQKLSSAVIAMPDSAPAAPRKSVFVNRDRDNRDGNRNTYRSSYNSRDGRDNNRGEGRDNRDRFQRNGEGRGNSQGRERYGNNQQRGYGDNQYQSKDKDDEGSSRPLSRPRNSKPANKSESPIEEVKKSRADFATRNAKDKKRYDNENSKHDGNGFDNNDKRSRNKNANSNFNGRSMDYSEDGYDSYYGGGRKRNKKSKAAEDNSNVLIEKITEIQIPAFISVKDFAEGIKKKSTEVITALMKLGVMATINQELDFDTACLLADSFGITATLLTEVTEEDILFEDDDVEIEENMKPRPPVVVVMGHVDHGKTSLLDKIRSASVVSGEAGGITQAIGAYTVKLKGRQITFLDTPGHEAFTTMRARGAQVTDIAILVVAADDGVMPQTIEAINHAKAANTEIIVAINKIDKPGANPDKVKQELSNYELIPEEWGGSTIMVPVSAKQGTGVDDLLEMVLLTADVLELKADPKRQAKGTVIEAKLDKSRGPVATVLVQRGTLKQGDSVVCGAMIGNVRAMYDDKGGAIKKAGPSIPVEILGLPDVPDAGEMLYAVTDDKVARQLVEKRKIKLREQQLHKSSKMTLENLAASLAAGDVKDLNLIIKADIQGSVEAVIQSLVKLSNDEVHVKIVHSGVGAINESDIVLADVSNAIIIGFNVRPNASIIDKAKEANVDIRLYDIIYKAIEDIEAAMKGMLAPTYEEVVLGHVEIRELFKVSGVGTIGGCYVLDGKIVRNCGVRVVRDDIVVYAGQLASLQRMKDAVKEVNAGYECGLSIENFNDIKIGDIIESFEMREVAR
ncbi:MAG: translation initiation factor IF-2 [Clostridia bacterium]|nr:translation initiation factor IF-2 [Clostridia bacterium]